MSSVEMAATDTPEIVASAVPRMDIRIGKAVGESTKDVAFVGESSKDVAFVTVRTKGPWPSAFTTARAPSIEVKVVEASVPMSKETVIGLGAMSCQREGVSVV